MAFASGTRLGPYEILEQIASRETGDVYKASDTRLNRTVALKVLPPYLSGNPHMRDRLEREARTIASLNHPNICTLHDVGKEDGHDFLVIEHVEGETLADRLKRGALPLDEALKLAGEIADALDKAHASGVVHRDLKPSNVMLTESGTKLRSPPPPHKSIPIHSTASSSRSTGRPRSRSSQPARAVGGSILPILVMRRSLESWAR
jgi:serine/threonine protein kinase